MNLANFKLITIICEPVLKSIVLNLARENGATGFTVTEVTGEGNGENNSGEHLETKLKIEIIAAPALASKLSQAVADRFFGHYSLITYSLDISVLRPEKFETS